MPTGIGTEVCWLCPTLDQTNPYDDLSGEGNDGTSNGSISVVSATGASGTHAFSFPNSGYNSDYISFSDIGITSSDPYTISMWIYAYDTGDTQGMLYAGDNNETTFALCQGIPYDIFQVGYSDEMLETGEMADETWQHVLFTYNRSSSGKTELWLDGTKESETVNAGTHSVNNSDLFLGRYGYDGMIDDFRAFDSVLSSTDIALLASGRGYETEAAGSNDPFVNSRFSGQQQGRIR